ncbi:MAG TPA: 50S ribosomal protein L25 [Patescibacteria group bacterium]
MTKYTLKAEKRTIFGKKINRLRKSGIIPSNLFGKNLESQAIQVNSKDFERVYKQAGETGIIYIQVEGESKERPTLVSGIAFNPINANRLHIDFHQVNLKEKVTAHVPVEITGESELVKSGAAALITSLDEIEVEALPTDIPEKIVFDISGLKEIGDHLKVSNAQVSPDVEITTDPEVTVVSLSEPEKEEVLPTPEEAAEEAATVTGEAAPAEAGEAKPEANKE